jgi:Short C-terminal domain/Phospholipase_D-nuclease N-terminal
MGDRGAALKDARPLVVLTRHPAWHAGKPEVAPVRQGGVAAGEGRVRPQHIPPKNERGRASVVLASIGNGSILLDIVLIFFFVIWIWILVVILSDLFRDHELSGWLKALWVLFLVFIPFLTALVYLIARGHGMRERAIAEQAEQKKQFDQYVQQQAAAATSPADQLHKLADLKDKGAISQEEYDAQKAKVLAE